MRVIPPVVVNDADLTASNVPENDFPEWDIDTTYAADGRVISTTTHSIYQSVAGGNIGNDPTDPANVVSTANPGGTWIYVSKTNRWRAFDGRNSAKTRQSGSITYDITVTRTSDIIAFMGVEAISIRVQVINADLSSAYDVTRDMLDTTEITTFFGYFTFAVDTYSRSALFYGIPAFPGTTLRITIDAGGGTAGVAIIGFGRRKIIGTMLSGTTPGIIDFSSKEVDEFGNFVVIERAFSKTVSFNVAFPTSAYVSISRALELLRATPAIYYEDEDLTHDLITLGFYTDFSPPLAVNTTLATIEITGVI